jgi:hypothetical protein
MAYSSLRILKVCSMPALGRTIRASFSRTHAGRHAQGEIVALSLSVSFTSRDRDWPTTMGVAGDPSHPVRGRSPRFRDGWISFFVRLASRARFRDRHRSQREEFVQERAGRAAMAGDAEPHTVIAARWLSSITVTTQAPNGSPGDACRLGGASRQAAWARRGPRRPGANAGSSFATAPTWASPRWPNSRSGAATLEEIRRACARQCPPWWCARCQGLHRSATFDAT